MGKKSSKPAFEGGQIYVELENAKLDVAAGSEIRGVIHVNQTQDFQAQNLLLYFDGQEKTTFQVWRSNGKSSYLVKRTERSQICQFCTVVASYQDCMSRPGQYSYPFSVTIPDWIPASMLFTGKRKTKMHIRYRLRAEMVPPDVESAKEEKKLFYGAKQPIYVTRPYKIPQLASMAPIVEEAHSEVGGFLSMGSTNCDIKVTMPKRHFGSGEPVSLTIDCDNSNCDKKVENYKVILARKVRGKFNSWGDSYTQTAEVVTVKEAANCPAKGKETKTISFNMPTFDAENKDLKVDPDDEWLKNAFTPSAVGKYFTIRYFIYVIVKHDAWNQRTGNKALSTEIGLFQAPVFADAHQLEFEKPKQWEPVVTGNVVNMMPTEEAANAENSEYFTGVMRPALESLKDGTCFEEGEAVVEDAEQAMAQDDEHDKPKDHTKLEYVPEQEGQQ